MPSKFRAPGLVHALALTLVASLPAVAVAKDARDKKPVAKEISGDDKLDKQMDWENKVLGPNTIKKIDLAKIQKLQAEEMARREKQEKLDQAEKERREREAAAAAEKQRNVKAAGTHEVPEIEEAPPPPPKPVEKHDDAFVDKVMSGKTEKKRVAATNDDVDQLLNKAKQEKGPAGAKTAKGRGDGVDALLATADQEAPIKTKPKTVEPIETVSAEAAAREATLKAIAAAQAKAAEERNRRKPVVPDAAMLRAQAAAAKAPPAEPVPAKTSAKAAGWTDPFASDGPTTTSSKSRGKVTAAAATVPAPSRSSGAGRRGPSARPNGGDWQDPFESGSGGSVKPRPAPKAHPAGRGKRPANWKDPFA